MSQPSPVVVPRQLRRSGPSEGAVAAVEREVTRTAELVLRLTALADRYARHPASAERVALLRATADLGRAALADIAAEPLTV